MLGLREAKTLSEDPKTLILVLSEPFYCSYNCCCCCVVFPSLQLGTGKTAGCPVGKSCLSRVSHSVCLSALGLAISPERIIRSTSFLACSRGPPGPRMCAACVSTPGEAQCIMLYVLTVYPAVSWAPSGRAHELPARRYASAVFATATCLSVCLSVRTFVCHTPVLCLAEQKQDREMYTF